VVPTISDGLGRPEDAYYHHAMSYYCDVFGSGEHGGPRMDLGMPPPPSGALVGAPPGALLRGGVPPGFLIPADHTGDDSVASVGTAAIEQGL